MREDRALEAARHDAAGVHAEPPTETRMRIRQPAPARPSGGPDGARCKHDHLCAHADPRDGPPRRADAVVRDRLDTNGHSSLHEDAAHVDVGVEVGARGEGLRHDDLQRILLRVVRAPELAEAAPLAADAVVAEHGALPSEREGAATECVVVRVDVLARNLGDRQVLFDAHEGRLELGRARALDAVRAGPEVEDGLRRALAEVRVVHRAAADAAAPEDANAEVLRGATAAILEEERQHVVLALIEIGGAMVSALLERDHLEARARELAHRDGAAGAGADDDRVGVEREIGAKVAASYDGHGRASTLGPSYPMTLHVRASR